MIEHKTQGKWKIQLTMVMNFVCSIPDSDETRIMRTESDINVMMSSETNESIEELFKPFLQREIDEKKFIYF